MKKFLSSLSFLLAFASFSTHALAANRNYTCTSLGTNPAFLVNYAEAMSLNFSDEGEFQISGLSTSGEAFDCRGALTRQRGLSKSGRIDKIDSATCSFLGGMSNLISNDLGKSTSFVSVEMSDRRYVYKCVVLAE